MTNSTDQERELFEQSERDRSPGVPLFILPASHKFRPGEYQNQYVEAAWRAWQARASVQPAGVAVPICEMCHGTRRVKEPGCDEGDCTRCLTAAPHPVSGEQS